MWIFYHRAYVQYGPSYYQLQQRAFYFHQSVRCCLVFAKNGTYDLQLRLKSAELSNTIEYNQEYAHIQYEFPAVIHMMNIYCQAKMFGS